MKNNKTKTLLSRTQKHVLLCCIIVALLLCGCGSAKSHPVNTFKGAVGKSQYQEAIDVFEEYIKGDSAKEIECRDYLSGYLTASYTKYVDEDITKDDFETVLFTLSKIDRSIHLITRQLEQVSLDFSYISISKDYYFEGVKYYESDDYAAAIESFTNVSEADTNNYNDAMAKKEEAIERFQANAISRINECLDAGDKAGVYEIVNDLWRVTGYPDSIRELVQTGLMGIYEADAEKAFEEEKYFSVIQIYDEAYNNDYCGEMSPRMNELRGSSVHSFLAGVKQHADELLGSDKDYESAIRYIQDTIVEVTSVGATELLPSLEQYVRDYQEYVPVLLSSLDPVQQAKYINLGAYNSETATDVNGVQYDGSTVIFPSGDFLASQVASGEDEAYLLYNLNYMYSSIWGTIYRPYDSLRCEKDWTAGTVVKIYGDDVLLYEAPVFTQESYDSIDFSLDASGVRNLRIVMLGVWTEETGWIGMYDRRPKVCMAEVYLQK